MMMRFLVLLLFILFFLLTFSSAQEQQQELHQEDCPEQCDLQTCEPPVDCLGGIVKDRCNCCFMCGQLEGERCYDKALVQLLPSHHKSYGSCGEGLRCRLRTDMEPDDSPEAVCYCLKTEAICGSDGVTYENECQLNQERYKRRDGLTTARRGPCRSVPQIVSPPEEIRNKTGSFVAFSCEASGWPVPVIEWHFRSGVIETSNPSALPSDDPHIAVQSRGGPSNYEVTGWLQLLDITPADQGTYSCVARNAEGEARSSAKLIVTDVDSPKYEYDNENEVL